MFNKRLGDQTIGTPAARVDPPARVRGNVSPARSPRAIVDLIGAIDTGFIDAIAEHRHPFLLRQRWHRSPVMRRQVQDGREKIGIVPGKPFDLSALDPANQAAPKDIPKSRNGQDRREEANPRHQGRRLADYRRRRATYCLPCECTGRRRLRRRFRHRATAPGRHRRSFASPRRRSDEGAGKHGISLIRRRLVKACGPAVQLDDIIGTPLTPMSVAGVDCRMWHRAAIDR
jgi:hypothetical protein